MNTKDLPQVQGWTWRVSDDIAILARGEKMWINQIWQLEDGSFTIYASEAKPNFEVPVRFSDWLNINRIAMQFISQARYAPDDPTHIKSEVARQLANKAASYRRTGWTSCDYQRLWSTVWQGVHDKINGDS